MSTPPKRSIAAREGLGHGVLARDVALTARPRVAESAIAASRAVAVEVEGDHGTRRARASASTIARPMPPAPPVTSATLPCSSPGGGACASL